MGWMMVWSWLFWILIIGAVVWLLVKSASVAVRRARGVTGDDAQAAICAWRTSRDEYLQRLNDLSK
jgi:hypothetical protein